MTPTIELIDKTIKTISGRELVASSEMVDLLLDLRMLCELQTPTAELAIVGAEI
jgi:hypothetical protein